MSPESYFVAAILARQRTTKVIKLDAVLFAANEAAVHAHANLLALNSYPKSEGWGDHSVLVRNITPLVNNRPDGFAFLQIYATYVAKVTSGESNVKFGLGVEFTKEQEPPNDAWILDQLIRSLPPSKGWRDHHVFVTTIKAQFVSVDGMSKPVD